MSEFDCFRRDFTFTRNSGGAYVNGKWTNGATSTFVIKASLQPATGQDMQMLPEGRRSNATYKMYTDTKLQTVSDNNPDYTMLDGDKYEVVMLAPNQNNIINHYKFLIGKVNPTDEL